VGSDDRQQHGRRLVGRGGNVSIVLGSSEAEDTRAAWSEGGDGSGIESKGRCVDRGVVARIRAARLLTEVMRK
jgi:hypothetical protein